MVAILLGFLAANLIGYAFIYHRLTRVEKELAVLRRVGILITGDQQPQTSVQRISRHQLAREIEKRSQGKAS